MAPSESIPVVLVHGWAGSFKETWQSPGIDELLRDAGREVIGLDLLGHGESDKPHDPEAYADLPGWFLDNLPSDRPVVDVAAFSLGALTTLRALVACPERFGRVLLSGIGDGVFEPSDGANSRRIVDALEGRAPEDDTFASAFAHYAHAPGKDLIALTAIMKRPPVAPLSESDLAKVTNEVCIVIGEKDFAGPAARLAAAFPNGRLTVLPRIDHFATPESFPFIDALLGFFAT